MAVLEFSAIIKELGFYYFAGIGFVLSGMFPSLGRVSESGETYSQAIASFRKQKFGWGAETRYEEATTTDTPLRNILSLLVIGVMAVIAWFVLNRLQNPVASIVIGCSFFLFGFKVRSNFRKHWSGSALEFDFGCVAMALLLYLISQG